MSQKTPRRVRRRRQAFFDSWAEVERRQIAQANWSDFNCVWRPAIKPILLTAAEVGKIRSVSPVRNADGEFVAVSVGFEPREPIKIDDQGDG